MKGHRPAAMTTNGSAGVFLGPGRRKREQLPVRALKKTRVLTPVAPVDNELEIAAGQRMEAVSYPDTPVPIIWIGCS